MNPLFELGEYSDKSDLLAKISKIKYEGKGTNTAEALRYLHTKVTLSHITSKSQDLVNQNIIEQVLQTYPFKK